MGNTPRPTFHPLIVEDDPNFALILARTLEWLGVPSGQIVACPDAEAAMGRLAQDGWTPTFAILDLHLPQRSGLELLEWIRSTPKLEKLAVFFLTSNQEPERVARAFALRAAAYFVKPMGLKALTGVVEGILGHVLVVP